MTERKRKIRSVILLLTWSLAFTAVPIDRIARLWQGGWRQAEADGILLADEGNAIRTYSFIEVGNIAQNNSNDILKQKADLSQAEYNKESQLSTYQSQVYNYYSGNTSNITEDSLYNLQENYENAYNTWTDAEDTLEKLKPKVAWQAQKLYIDILQGEKQILIQEQEIQRLAAEYELAKVKTAFGVITQTQLNTTKTQWDNARDTLDSLQNTMTTNKNTMREYLNLADEVDFALENPPVFGQYGKDFNETDVLQDALKNSLALKQAKREVEELSKRIERYEINGEHGQAERLAASGASKDLAIKNTKLSLTRTVENVMKKYQTLDAALDKAKEELYTCQRACIAVKLRQNVGAATLNELRQAEKSLMTAEKNLQQAEYDCYLETIKLILLKDGILVS